MIFQETDLLVQVFCSTKYRMMMLRKKYADDTGYTVDYDNTQSKDDIVLKKGWKKRVRRIVP